MGEVDRICFACEANSVGWGSSSTPDDPHHSRCFASAFFAPKTAAEGRLCLPLLGGGSTPSLPLALTPSHRNVLQLLAFVAFFDGKPVPTRTPVHALRQINGIGPFIQLDVSAPWIRNERKRAAVAGLRVGPIQFDSGRFELLDEALQVRHVKADVVEHPPFGGDGRRGG